MTPDLDIFISRSLLTLISRRAGPDAYGAACVSLARQLHTKGREGDFAAWMESSPAARPSSDRLSPTARGTRARGRRWSDTSTSAA